MWWHPPQERMVRRYRHWWDSRTARAYAFGDLAWKLLTFHLTPTVMAFPANDTDQHRW